MTFPRRVSPGKQRTKPYKRLLDVYRERLNRESLWITHENSPRGRGIRRFDLGNEESWIPRNLENCVTILFLIHIESWKCLPSDIHFSCFHSFSEKTQNHLAGDQM